MPNAICRRLSSDRQKVKQILLNLLSNALKFTHQGGVTIAARAQREGYARMLLSVSRHRHRHRARRSGPDLRRLPAARQLADARLRRHRPRPVHLPAARADARRPDFSTKSGRQRIDLHADASDQGTEMTTKPDRPRVLLVDDYPDAREMYTEYLRVLGVRRRRGGQRHGGAAERRRCDRRISS